MKKTFKLFVLFIALAIGSNLHAQTEGSILANGVHMVPVMYCGEILPFERASDGKIGFFRNNSDANIAISPRFDDVFIDDSPLMPVKHNGKWGVVDVSLRELTTADQQPIIPCEYDRIELIDGSTNAVRAFYKGKSFVLKLVVNGYDVTVERH